MKGSVLTLITENFGAEFVFSWMEGPDTVIRTLVFFLYLRQAFPLKQER